MRNPPSERRPPLPRKAQPRRKAAAASKGETKSPPTVQHEAEPIVEALPPNAVILQLVAASVAMRVRFRALLQVLVSSGVVNAEEYYHQYDEMMLRDADALTGALMLSRKDFQKLYGDWKKADSKRYPTRQEIRPKGRRKKQAS